MEVTLTRDWITLGEYVRKYGGSLDYARELIRAGKFPRPVEKVEGGRPTYLVYVGDQEALKSD